MADFKPIFRGAMAVAALCAAASANASTWYQIGGGEGFTISVDLETIQWNGSIVTFWDKWVSTDPNDKLAYAQGRGMIDCQKLMRKSLYTVEYYRDGTNGSSDGLNVWKPIAPDSTSDGVRRYLCSHKPKAK